MQIDLKQMALQLQNQFTEYDGSIVMCIVNPPNDAPHFLVYYSENEPPSKDLRTWFNFKVKYKRMGYLVPDPKDKYTKVV